MARYTGAYTKLAANGRAAMLAAIEVYNKPNMTYRDELVVILLVNAWELLAKAVVSKSRQSIYYPKRRGEPYRTFSTDDALRRASSSSAWPEDVEARGVIANVRLLTIYRDNAIHFYNRVDFSSLLYSLMQTAVLNFRDVHRAVARIDLAEDVNWTILPLGVHLPLDPLEFLRGSRGTTRQPSSPAIEDFIATLQVEKDALASDAGDSGRLLTIFRVNLQSVKKVGAADVVVGVNQDNPDSTVLTKPVDPNKSHPLRQKDVLEKLELPFKFAQYEFLATTQELGLRADIRYCWADKDVNLVRWSHETVERLSRLSQGEVKAFREAYTIKQRASRRTSRPVDERP